MVSNNRENFEFEYRGLSTDVKPLNACVNSLFWELDTGDVYYFNGTSWAKCGGTTANNLVGSALVGTAMAG